MVRDGRVRPQQHGPVRRVRLEGNVLPDRQPQQLLPMRQRKPAHAQQDVSRGPVSGRGKAAAEVLPVTCGALRHQRQWQCLQCASIRRRQAAGAALQCSSAILFVEQAPEAPGVVAELLLAHQRQLLPHLRVQERAGDLRRRLQQRPPRRREDDDEGDQRTPEDVGLCSAEVSTRLSLWALS